MTHTDLGRLTYNQALTDHPPGGLGTATARLLQSKGCSLALLYAPFESQRRDKILEATFGSTTSSGVSAFECDITDETSVAAAFQQIERHAQSQSESTASPFPSILVNAAGYVSVQPLEETSQQEAMRNFLPNLLGPFNASTAFFRMYRRRVDAAGAAGGSADGEGRVPPGRIVSISSQASHVALDGHGAYCASKAGLNGLTRCMASEWGGRGVTANTVSPTGKSSVLSCDCGCGTCNAVRERD